MATRTNPFEEMERLMSGMTRSLFSTNVRLERDEDGYVVLADLPGFEKAEIDLLLEDGVLLIDAENGTDHEVGMARSARQRHVHERVRIPAEVREEEVAARYHNGVLEVRLPTVADAEDDPTSIDID